MPVNVNADTCIGCGACVGVCPVGALSMNADSKSECDVFLSQDHPLRMFIILEKRKQGSK